MAQTDTLCVNATTNNYFVTSTSGSNYFWDTQGNGLINSGQGTANANITWTQTPGTYLLTVTETSQDGCVGLPQQLFIVVLPAYNDTTDITLCENNLPFSWNGNSYAAAGVYSTTLTSSTGCDSVVTLNLVTSPSLTGSFSNTACSGSGYSVVIGGTTYNEANPSGTETLVSSTGCDSVVTVNLTFNSFTTSIASITSCNPITWLDGNTYAASNNTATFTFVGGSVQGCDSVITLNFTLLQPNASTDVQQSCGPFTWIDGVTYSSSINTPTFTLTNAAGCDSVITLNLTIDNFTTGVDVISSCDPITWLDGNTYSASNNSATFTIVGGSVQGCDSVITLNFTLLQPSASTDVQQSCGPFTWIDGNTYNASTNTPTFTITNSAGCDSVITLDLTIDNFTTGVDVISSCDPITWLDGNTYSTSNNSATFTIVGGSAQGCDSVITLNFTLLQPSASTDVQQSCGPFTWIDGNTYNASTNTPTFTITNAAGCDSVITLDLTINSFTSATDNISDCNPINWLDGNTYNTSNNSATFTIAGGSVQGCDSLITLNFTLLQPSASTDVQQSCGPFTWIDGVTYSSSTNTPTFTLTNAAGCDSVITLNLTIDNFTTGVDVISSCDPITWLDSNTYSASNNTATFTIVGGSVQGCDSVITLNFNLLQPTASTDVQQSCGPFTWIDGNTYNASTNTPTFTLTNAAGCDSVITLNLTIDNFTTGVNVISNCDPITWLDGNTYNASNNSATFIIVGGSVQGCDSVITLNFTLLQPNASTDVQQSCGPFTWIDGVTYSSSTNTPTFTLTNAAGCDSVITLNLTIDNFTTGVDVISSCDPITWLDGNTYAASNNTATFTFVGGSLQGCDSVITLNFTLLQPNASTDVQQSCGPFTWIDGNTYNASTNTPTFTLTNAAGCDSVITLNLTIDNFTTGVNVISSCDPITWLDGNTYSTSNNSATFTIVGGSAQGCDSVITLNFTLLQPSASSDVQQSCGPFTWIDGVTYSSSTNTPTFTLTNAAGCDSVITLNLTIDNFTTGVDVISSCDPITWLDGNTYSASNNSATFTIVGGSVQGCDSVITLNFTLLQPSVSTDVQQSCGPFTWIDGNTYNASTNTPTFTLTNAAGCDSVITLDLTILPAVSSSTNLTICDAQLPFVWNGLTFTAAGSQSATLISAEGCDSIVTLNLSVNQQITASIDSSICSAQLPLVWNGLTFTAAGSQSLILTSSAGCDSVVTLNLSENPQLNTSIDSTICSAQLPLVWNGLSFTAAGSQSVTLTSEAGCDSVVTLSLTVHNTFTDTLAISICEGSNYILPDGISATASGIYTSSFQNQFGCDSSITTILTVDPQITLTLSNDTGICAGTTIEIIASGADEYSWNPAEGLSSTTGSTVSASPSNTTTYSVTGQSGTCIANDSIEVEVLPLPELSVSPGSVNLCFGDSILLSATGAESYSWTDTSLFDCDTCTTALLTPETSTTVVLEGTLGLCKASVQIPVQVLEWPVAQITADTSICLGDTIALLGSGGLNYLWSNGDTSAQSSVSPQTNSSYTLIVDNGVCADTASIEIDVHPLPIAYAGEDTTIRYGTSVQLNATATGNFTWYPLDQLDCGFCLDPIASPPGTIEYCLNVTNTFGCSAFDCITITVDTLCADLFIPNVFAPGTGGHEANNCFRIYGGDCITDMSLKVFTRWGEMVFESERIGDCWDGTHKGKELNPGVYIYHFDAGTITGERISKQGNVTLIK